MIELISKIFKGKNYDEIESIDYKIYSLKENDNFLIVITKDDLSKILDEQINLFVKCKQAVNQPEFDKNANLLVLNKVVTIDSVKKDDFLKIEEDPYYFKKSIIYYTEQELNKLNETIGEFDVLEFIEISILKEEVFEQHKNHFDKNHYQSLLYRIAHKLPFIKINISHADNLKSLEEINKNSIGDKIFNDLLETKFFTLTNEQLSVLTENEILEIFKTTTADEN